MTKAQAHAVLRTALAAYRAEPYPALLRLLVEPDVLQGTAPDGTPYAIELSAVWDDKAHGPVRALGAISCTGWTDFAPVFDDFIMAPDGSFVDDDR